MPINPHRLEKMQEYGLTEYEARAYLALADLGVATAHDVASVSRVPRTKIYSVLDALHGKQLVEIMPERPKKYQLVPFQEYLDAVERATKARLARISEDRATFAGALARPRSVSIDRAGTFHVLKGRKNVVTKSHEMLARARSAVISTGSQWQGVRLAYVVPTLREAAARGASVRALVEVCERNLEPLSALAEIGTVRHLGSASGSTILIVDERELLLAHPVPDDEHLFQGEDVAIWTDDRAIVGELSALVEILWERGEEFAVRLEELSGTTLTQPEDRTGDEESEVRRVAR